MSFTYNQMRIQFMNSSDFAICWSNLETQENKYYQTIFMERLSYFATQFHDEANIKPYKCKHDVPACICE